MEEKFYITTSLPYVNAPPHIGFALEAIQADVIARAMRLHGSEVYFLSGTDEHGAKILRAAESAGINVKTFVDENASRFNKLLSALNISNNDFIRTSDKQRHWPGAQELWKKLDASGDIYKAKYKGLYCVGHEAFITERDLISGKCADHDKEPEEIEEENYFFRLSKYTAKIKEEIESDRLAILPGSRKNEMLSFISGGLEDISFSRPARDISWGVPVPGDPTQTMYVWCDALSNYISALGYGSEWRDFSAPAGGWSASGRKGGSASGGNKFWPADVHIIGKDILRFHAVIWAGMLLSAGLELPRSIFVHGFITVGGRKMSKTLGNVVDPFDLAERFGVDAVRYYFLREVPPYEDGDFTEEKFIAAYNDNLANGLGNFVARTSKMIFDYFAGDLQKPHITRLSDVPMQVSSDLMKGKGGGKMETFGVEYIALNLMEPQYREALNSYQFSRALDIVWELLGMLDAYIQIYEPFKLIKSDPEKTQAVLWETAYGALFVARMLEPFMPETSEEIFKIFGGSRDPKEWNKIRIMPHASLFPRK